VTDDVEFEAVGDDAPADAEPPVEVPDAPKNDAVEPEPEED
jgi:hypothetical protein